MSFGKMITQISIMRVDFVTDDSGFKNRKDVLIAETRAYHEGRHGSVRWVNLAAFSSATDLFRIRMIPGVEVTPDNYILCGGVRYKIHSVENVKSRGMYLEILAERTAGVVG